METKKIAIKILIATLIILVYIGARGYYHQITYLNKPGGYPFIIPTTADKNLDSDKDGIPDSIEKVIKTNPNKADTDGDTYNDLAEIKNGYDPLIPGSTKLLAAEWQVLKDKIRTADKEFYEKEFETLSAVDKNLDSDYDGLPDAVEKIFGSNINKADTDGDGVNDLQEIQNDHSPIIAGEPGKYTQEDAAAIFGKMSAENNEFVMKEIIQPALNRARDKARVASYKATVSSLQIEIILCCDDDIANIIQTKEGEKICILDSSRKLPLAADIYASSIAYEVLGQCNTDNPGLKIIPTGFPVSACNAAATVRSAGIDFPEGC